MAYRSSVPQVDFSILGDLGNTYKSAKREAVRERTLAEIGQSGDWSRGIEALAGGGDLEGALTLSKIAEARAGKPTDEIREYNFDVQQRKAAGRPVPTFGDWKTELKKAGATKVEVNSGEKGYDTELGKDYAKNFIKTQEGGRTSQGAISSLNLMETLTRDPNFYSGSGGPLVTTAKRAGASIGLTVPEGAAANELFSSMSNRLVLDASGGSLGTGFSNADRDFIVQTVPTIANTPEGNRAVIAMQRKVYERQADVAKMAREYVRRNGRLDAGFDEELAKFAEQSPLFPRMSAAPTAPATPQQQGSGPVRVKSKQERDALPPGTQYIAPDGSLRTRQ